jgi:hypothetical protein
MIAWQTPGVSSNGKSGFHFARALPSGPDQTLIAWASPKQKWDDDSKKGRAVSTAFLICWNFPARAFASRIG